MVRDKQKNRIRNIGIVLILFIALASVVYFGFGSQLGLKAIPATGGATSCQFLKPLWGFITCEKDMQTNPTFITIDTGSAKVITTLSDNTCALISDTCAPFSRSDADSITGNTYRASLAKAYICNAGECTITESYDKVEALTESSQIQTRLQSYVGDSWTPVTNTPAICNLGGYSKLNNAVIIVSQGGVYSNSAGSGKPISTTIASGTTVYVLPTIYKIISSNSRSDFQSDCLSSGGHKSSWTTKWYATEEVAIFSQRGMHLVFNLPNQGQGGLGTTLWSQTGCSLNTGQSTMTEKGYELISPTETSQLPSSEKPTGETTSDFNFQLPLGQQLAFIDDWVERTGFKNLIYYTGSDITYTADEVPNRLYIDTLSKSVWSVRQIDTSGGCYYVPANSKKTLSYTNDAECQNSLGSNYHFNQATLTCTNAKTCVSGMDCGQTSSCMNKQQVSSSCDYSKKVVIDDVSSGTCAYTTKQVSCCTKTDCGSGYDCITGSCVQSGVIRVDCPFSYECCAPITQQAQYTEKKCNLANYPNAICGSDFRCSADCGNPYQFYWDDVAKACKEIACPVGQTRCSDAVCRADCSGITPCATGTTRCSDGVCRSDCGIVPPKSCTDGTVEGNCSKVQEGYRCVNLQTIKDDSCPNGGNQTCSTNADCKNGTACVEGKCIEQPGLSIWIYVIGGAVGLIVLAILAMIIIPIVSRKPMQSRPRRKR